MNEPSSSDPVYCPHNKYDFPDVRISNFENIIKGLFKKKNVFPTLFV